YLPSRMPVGATFALASARSPCGDSILLAMSKPFPYEPRAMRLTCRFQPGSRRQFLVVAALVVVVLAAPASQTYAGAPPSAGRSFSTVSQLPAHLTLTVTDHGATCGLPANSTATWFLEFGGPGAERVFCSRNDRAAQVSYP